MSPLSLYQTLITVLAVVLIVSQELSLLKPSFVLGTSNYTRKDFPPDFVFGSGVSAYQYEGAVSEDGRTPSTLDIQAYNGNFNGDNGDVACDGYHKYKEDIQLMADTALEAYRFSISWSRLLPNGKGPVNPKAVEYYNNVINGALKHGVQPHIIMMHLDPPQALEDAYGGWMNRKMVEDFTIYADTCFREFGDRVKHWTTINEPNCYVSHVSKLPFIEGHNLLLGHASVVKLYKQKYKAKQHGNVGISVSTSWYTPKKDTKEDLIAVKRVHHFTSGWFIHPVVFGDYPATMKQSLGDRLPSFSDHESKLLRGSFDFIGINSYDTQNVENNPSKLDLQANCRVVEDDDGGKGKEVASSSSNLPLAKWIPPSPTRVKLNVDASWVEGSIAAGGGVLRDSEGHWILGFAVQLAATDAAMAELRAAIFGLQFMEILGYEDFDLELDASEVVRMLRTPTDFGNHVLGPLLWDASKIMDSLGSVDVLFVPRKFNAIAHGLAKFGRGMRCAKTLWDHVPSFLESAWAAENGHEDMEE